MNWMQEKRGGGDVSGAGGTVALSLWCRCVVAYIFYYYVAG